MICWSVYYDALRVITQACYSGTVDDLQGPFTVPNGWSHLFVPFYDPEGTVCISNNIMFVFLCFLLFLEVIMVVWFVIIIRVAIRVVSGKSAEDLRSDDEEEVDVEEAEFQNEIAEPIEEEVGVEAIDLKGWERRTNVKRNASSSGVSSSRHSDHKELLNRFGCEKQIA
jgi:acyl-CoA-dependent ceramide synthase